MLVNDIVALRKFIEYNSGILPSKENEKYFVNEIRQRDFPVRILSHITDIFYVYEKKEFYIRFPYASFSVTSHVPVTKDRNTVIASCLVDKEGKYRDISLSGGLDGVVCSASYIFISKPNLDIIQNAQNRITREHLEELKAIALKEAKIKTINKDHLGPLRKKNMREAWKLT